MLGKSSACANSVYQAFPLLAEGLGTRPPQSVPCLEVPLYIYILTSARELWLKVKTSPCCWVFMESTSAGDWRLKDLDFCRRDCRDLSDCGGREGGGGRRGGGGGGGGCVFT